MRPSVIGTSKPIEPAVQPVRPTTSTATTSCVGPRPVDGQAKVSLPPAATEAANAVSTSSGSAQTAMAITLARRKQADHTEAAREPLEPSTPSLRYRSGRCRAGLVSQPKKSSTWRWAISRSTSATSRPGIV